MSQSKEPTKFVISRTFNAPRDRIWKAWTEPEQMAQWWGPKGFTTDVRTLDLEPGGTFHYRLQSPQGQEMWGKFIFREIVPKQRLVFLSGFSDADGGLTRHPMAPDWPLQTHTTVTFTEEDGKTTVTVTWEPYEASESERDTFEKGTESMQAGWTGTFDKLERHLTHKEV